MKLYSYWRSSTSYRVRIALALKGIPYDTVAVNLVAGEQKADAYHGLNPSQAVPTLVTDTGVVLTQSLAIMDYLDATVPEPSLLPGDAVLRAQVLAASLVMAMDVHPVNNLRVLSQLKSMGHDEDARTAWMQHWMSEGLTAFNALIDPDTPFCFSDAPAFADICLIPQLYNAHRWGVSLEPWPRLAEIETRCLAHPAFAAAHPDFQPDAPEPETT